MAQFHKVLIQLRGCNEFTEKFGQAKGVRFVDMIHDTDIDEVNNLERCCRGETIQL